MFGKQRGNEYCFGGQPYVPEALRGFAADTEQLCVERWGFNQWEPMYLAMADPNDGTDRVMLARKDGVVQMYKRSTGVYQGDVLKLTDAFVDGEAGLTGLLAHPAFKDNGRFFIHYSCTLMACGVTCDPGMSFSLLSPCCPQSFFLFCFLFCFNLLYCAFDCFYAFSHG